MSHTANIAVRSGMRGSTSKTVSALSSDTGFSSRCGSSMPLSRPSLLSLSPPLKGGDTGDTILKLWGHEGTRRDNPRSDRGHEGTRRDTGAGHEAGHEGTRS